MERRDALRAYALEATKAGVENLLRPGTASRTIVDRARELGAATAVGALASDVRSGAAFGALFGAGVSGVKSLRRLRRGEVGPARALADTTYEGAAEAVSGAFSGLAAATTAIAVSHGVTALGITGIKASLAAFGLPLASAIVTAVVVRRLYEARVADTFGQRFAVLAAP
ncbi:MAG: hypothetical protein ABFS46_15745 [Myxococcota bacterium]